MLFESYTRKKELEEYNTSIEKYSEGYADLRVIGEIEGFPIQHLVINPKGSKRIFFIAGIHGDEIGGPYGVLEFVKQKMRIPEVMRVEIIPLANPTGFIKNTRENGDGIDINRKFYGEDMIEESKIIWSAINSNNIEYLHTLHEDTEIKTFYLYYTHHKTLAKGLRDDVAKKYFNIFGKDERKPLNGETHELYGDKVHEGLIPLPHTKRNTIEDRALEEQSIPYITTETPGKASLTSRAKCNRDIIKYVIHNI